MIGDADDFLVRIAEALPPWFGESNPARDGALVGPAQSGAINFSQRLFAAKQMRVSTASAGYLDLIAEDFFGRRLTRKPGQTDGSFRAQIISRLFRQGVTRAGMAKMLRDLTGREPIIFEPANIVDAGAYGFCYGYGVGGGWGSLSMPMTAFVTVFRPASNVAAGIGGYGVPAFGYGVAGRYLSEAELVSNTTDRDIYEAINRARPVGSTIWVQIVN